MENTVCIHNVQPFYLLPSLTVHVYPADENKINCKSLVNFSNFCQLLTQLLHTDVTSGSVLPLGPIMDHCFAYVLYSTHICIFVIKSCICSKSFANLWPPTLEYKRCLVCTPA